MRDKTDFAAVMAFAVKAKRQMLDRADIAASKKCPFCTDGRWHFRLVGPRKHLHAACDGCALKMME